MVNKENNMKKTKYSKYIERKEDGFKIDLDFNTTLLLVYHPHFRILPSFLIELGIQIRDRQRAGTYLAGSRWAELERVQTATDEGQLCVGRVGVTKKTTPKTLARR